MILGFLIVAVIVFLIIILVPYFFEKKTMVLKNLTKPILIQVILFYLIQKGIVINLLEI